MYDETAGMNDWDYALYNMRRQRRDRVDALIQKYGFPINEKYLLAEDYAEYDLLRDDIQKMENEWLKPKAPSSILARKSQPSVSEAKAQAKEIDGEVEDTESFATRPTPRGSSLDDEDMAKNAEIVKKKKERPESKLSLDDLSSIVLDTLKYTPEALGEMLADGIIAKEYLQTMKKTNKKLIDKYGQNIGAADGTDNYYHALLQCQLAKISPESRDYGLRAGYLKEIYDYHKKKGKMLYDVLIGDMRKDLKNNRYGSNLGARNRNSNKSCYELLDNYRTRNLKNENIR